MFEDRILQVQQKIKEFKSKGLKVFSTSSFQTNSVVLLHIISRIDYDIPVFFLNTGYHFPETLLFKSDLKSLLDINVIDLTSDIPKHQQRDSSGRLMYTSDPNYCCYMNKVRPLDDVKNKYHVWMSGIRANQNENRANKEVIELDDDGIIRYHPILNFTNSDVKNYINFYDLPSHPLDHQGYKSIGCMPCTQKANCNGTKNNSNREGRWQGLNKTECGLHN